MLVRPFNLALELKGFQVCLRLSKLKVHRILPQISPMDFGVQSNFFGPVWPILNWGVNQTVLDLTVGGLAISLIAAVLKNYWLRQEIKGYQQDQLLQADKAAPKAEDVFQDAIANAPLPIMIHAEDGEVLHINKIWTELTGYTPADLPTTRAWAELAYGENAADILANVITPKYSLTSPTDENALAITTRSGSKRIWKFSSSPLEHLLDDCQAVITIGIDITQRRTVEMALKDSEERYRSIYTQAAVGLVNGTLQGKLIDVNPCFCSMLGYSREELLSKSVKEITHPDDWLQTKGGIKRLADGEIPNFFHEKRYLRKDGSFFWSNTGVSLVQDFLGQPKHMLAVIRDISDRVKAEEKLKHDALHDELTGLPNRSLLMERLELALKRIKRHPETQLAVLFLDLDNFKIVNDSLGHLVGDELLLAISTKLELVIRETDVAARLGGDEFVVLLEEINDLSEVTMVAERILDVLQTPISIANRELFPGVSIGIATSEQNPLYQASELLRDADVAMYWAKHSGRGRYVVFDPDMHLQALQRLQIQNNLRKALDNDEFLLYFQPIVDLESQTIEAFEALLCWQLTDKDLWPAQQFIDIAEEIGLTLSISEWGLRTACQQLARWQAWFPNRSLGIHINLPGQQLEESLLLKLKENIAIHNLEKNSLKIEITEGMLMQNIEITQNLLSQVRTHGVEIVIDGFGTGYSCLPHLHQLPVNTIKIDHSFIKPAESDRRNAMITKSMIALCKSLGMRTIADGVETAQQLHWLNSIGCDAVQGDYFTSPVTAEKATELLRQKMTDIMRMDISEGVKPQK